MANTVRAIYENGHLILLSPLNLGEGEEVDVTVQTAREKRRTLLSDILVSSEDLRGGYNPTSLPARGAFDDEASQGKPLSEIIIEERGDYE
jgi:predicted DNA-binding antitoxin AbrB/MazE fold protein